MRNFIFFFLVGFFLVGCSKKTTQLITKTDTLKVFEQKIVEVPVTSVVKIPSLCDSLGNAKEMDLNLHNGRTKVIVKNNTIYIKEFVKGSENTKKETYKSKSNIESKVKVIYKLPYWVYMVCVAFLLSICLNIRLIFRK